MKTNTVIVLLFLVLFASVNKGLAQSTYSPETNVIYYFTKYVEWPDNMKPGSFVIGVYGNDAIYEELNKGIAGRRVGNKRIVISKIEDLDPAYLNVSILYIGTDKVKRVNQLINLTQNEPILIVTKLSDEGVKGACMNMKVVNEKINLEIDKANIESRGLKIASELLAFDKTLRQ